ncbi:LuxR C-terminal-related transcriptional regulator [Hoeflea sp.]|uniref:LuxR C-terminal-related transcriptional regulator n=1 Tax=Hoeflea sp. TaxID=1940281 RepID=UPI003B01D393
MKNEPEDLDGLREAADLLGGSFPGHTMQRLRTPDGKYRYTYVSSGVRDSFGLDPVELMALREVDHSWLHPEDKPRFIEALETSAATLGQLDIEVRVALDNGQYRWVRSIGKPRRLDDGSTLWDGVALDVTNRRDAVEALERTLKQVRQNETSEGRLAHIAATDIQARLSELRGAISDLAVAAQQDRVGPAIDNVQSRFEQFERALVASRELVVPGSDTDDAGTASSDQTVAKAKQLTKRQIEILSHVGKGASNRDIADLFGISEGTVKLHLSSIFKRLGVQNRTEAALKWRSLGASFE